MKVAVSIPDPIFAHAEVLARRLNTSRSELYTRALQAFVGLHEQDPITAAMNAAIDALEDDPDDLAREVMRSSARTIAARTEW